MAKYAERFCVNHGLFENPSKLPLKFYELQKIIDGTPQPVDLQAMEDYKKSLTDSLLDDGIVANDLSSPCSFSIISQGFAGIFYWAGKDEDYNVLYEIPLKYNSETWGVGDFDEQGIGCAWYNKVVGKENDFWEGIVLKPGTPPDISDGEFKNNIKKYAETFIPNGPLSEGNIITLSNAEYQRLLRNKQRGGRYA